MLAPSDPGPLKYGHLRFLPVVPGRMEFAAAIRHALLREQPKVVALHLRGVFDLEYTALKMWTEAEQRLREAGVTVWLVGLNPGVLAMVRNSPLGEALGDERMFHNLEQAVAFYQSRYLGAGPHRS